MRVDTVSRPTSALPRREIAGVVLEYIALFLIFIVAFTGRDRFGDNVKTLLTALTVLVGATSSAAALAIAYRAITTRLALIPRLALSALMLFAALYSTIHVLR